MNEVETLEAQMQGIVKSVAYRYASRCWWADVNDLEQQAWTIVLEVLRECPPLDDRGNLDRKAFGSWAYSATMKQLSRYLWRQSAPVSCPSDHDVRELAGVHHTPIAGHAKALPGDGIDENQARSIGVSLADVVDPETLTAALRAETITAPAVRERIAWLYIVWMANEDGWKTRLDAVLAIYTEGLTPREAAQRHSIDIYDLYKTTEYMRGIMREDRVLRGLLSDLEEGRME